MSRRRLSNMKQEKFAQLYANGNGSGRSYRMAGYKGNTRNACALARKPHVRERIDYLIARRARQHEIDHAQIAARLNQVFEAALEDGELNVARLSAVDLGKLYGLFKERFIADIKAETVTKIELVAPK